jgi:hypothetical protein
MAALPVCWKCGAALRGVPLPLSRTAECPACKAELHACRMCQYYDARTTRQCTEIRAEEIIKKDQANYCDWFKPRANAFDARAQVKAGAAKVKLDGLFGAAAPAPESADPARAAAEQFFKGKDKTPPSK